LEKPRFSSMKPSLPSGEGRTTSFGPSLRRPSWPTRSRPRGSALTPIRYPSSDPQGIFSERPYRIFGSGGLDGYDGHVRHAGGERVHVVWIAGQEANPGAQSCSRDSNDCIDGVVSPGLAE